MPSSILEKKIKQKEKYLRKKIGQAIKDYNMISPGDRLLLAVSGGQDSYTALNVLASDTVKKSLNYELIGGHIIMDSSFNNCSESGAVKKIFKDTGVEGHMGSVNITNRGNKEEITCFWCSWNKRKALFEMAERLKCNKVVFGHHKDDIIETVLLNLFFNGEISTMNPKQELFGGKLTIIRPLCYVEKKEITAYTKLLAINAVSCSCPYGDISKRKFVRDIIEQAAKTSPVVKSNIFRAPGRVKTGYLGEME